MRQQPKRVTSLGQNGMRYILDFGPQTLNLQMEGEFTFRDAHTFKRLMNLIREEHTREEVRLNIKNLHFIDSTALHMMMLVHDFAKRLHMTLVFVEPQGQVKQALAEAARFNTLNIAA